VELPFFGGWEFSLGSGIVGGHLVDLEHHGEVAGELAETILRRGSTEGMETVEASPNRYMFDYSMLARFGLEEAALPEESIVINRPESLYRKHATNLFALLSGALFVVACLAFFNLYRKEKLLEKLAHIDPLTELLNRRSFEDEVEKERLRAVRSGSTLAVAIADLDHFKGINDTHGHKVGDRVLTEFARVVRENTRRTDILARYGGEEFIFVFPNTTAEKAESILARCLRDFSLVEIPGSATPVKRLTFSAGIAIWDQGADMDDVIRAADKKMYRAKTAGRRCIVT
jgi:diguanylate cyclase (GGDEF)-like protein